MNEARLSVIGIGPGDPELITLKGVRLIERAGVVFVPHSQSSGKSLALAREAGTASRAAWQSSADIIAAELAGTPGHAGAFLLLGDPSLYGTFTYVGGELAARHPHITVEIVPGVTSFAAAAACTQTPLALGDDRVAIIPATAEMDTSEWRCLFEHYQTVVLMKVGGALPQVLTTLEVLDLLGTATYVERVGMEGERIVRDVRTLEHKPTTYFSLMIVRRGG